MLMGAFAVAGLTVSCQSSPLTAPQGTTITFLSAKTMIATGSMDVVVTVIQGGQSTGTGPNATAPTGGQPVHDNTAVFFTTTLGTIVPAQAKTTNGLATVTLVGDGRTGPATIVAISGAVTANTLITLTASTVSNVSISLPGSAGVVSTPAGEFHGRRGRQHGRGRCDGRFCSDGSIQSWSARSPPTRRRRPLHLYGAGNLSGRRDRQRQRRGIGDQFHDGRHQSAHADAFGAQHDRCRRLRLPMR